ncbi:MAG: ribosome biogenesis GTPase Der, partial [Clostridia bacterium]|nr:ribosome biogenesis GTPase Der [Clostridia bacterium]
MAKPVIAIVGRPNVGKSTLFNKLIGERRAIVEDTPGVTRDRIYGECEWRGRVMMVIDTGGIEPKTDSVILQKMREQAQIAIETADVIIFMVDIRTGLVADDLDIALMLKKSGKPVIPVVNKSDRIGDVDPTFYEFYELGFETDPIAISSLHGSGSGDVLDAVLDALPEFENEEEDEDTVAVAVIGKPNAGKSSLVNRILGDERCIVSDMPGTTRDAVDTYFENAHGRYNFIDTAGIRRQSKVDDRVEKI